MLATGKKRIGVLGLVFKSDTDDLRESPACALVKSLLRAGREVRIFDPRVRPERLMGANRAFVEKELPGLPARLVDSATPLLRECEVIVVTSSHPAFESAVERLNPGQILVDLVRLTTSPILRHPRTVGICW